MKANDVLMKKWCFGFGRSNVKARNEAVQVNGELHTFRSFPKYRTIVLKVSSAKEKNGEWEVEGVQYASLKAKPKKIKLKLKEKNGVLYAPNQKKPYLRIDTNVPFDNEGMPPVGSLITVNKKHAIVTEVKRNEIKIWTNGVLQSIVCKPGSVKWHSDKILLSALERAE